MVQYNQSINTFLFDVFSKERANFSVLSFLLYLSLKLFILCGISPIVMQH